MGAECQGSWFIRYGPSRVVPIRRSDARYNRSLLPYKTLTYDTGENSFKTNTFSACWARRCGTRNGIPPVEYTTIAPISFRRPWSRDLNFLSTAYIVQFTTLRLGRRNRLPTRAITVKSLSLVYASRGISNSRAPHPGLLLFSSLRKPRGYRNHGLTG